MCCCCSGKKVEARAPRRPPPTQPTTTYLTRSGVSSTLTIMETKDDPVARSVGHLLRSDQPPPPFTSAPPSESRTSFTPPSTRSSISIPTSEIIPTVLVNQTGATADTELPPPSINTATAAPPSFQTPFACIKIQLNDQLIAYQFPIDAVHLIRRTIESSWPRGIQREEPTDRFDESNTGRNFKLRGNPFYNLPQTTTSLGETIPACRLVTALLDNLSRAGWVLTLSADSCSGMRQHKPTLVFRYQDPAPAPQQWASLAMMQVGPMDTLRLIDAPRDLCMDLQVALQESKMTSRHGSSFENVYDIELGMKRVTADNVDLPRMMLIMLGVLDRHGFTVAASIDQAQDHGKPDTWYVCRSEGWSPGMPVFHR